MEALRHAHQLLQIPHQLLAADSRIHVFDKALVETHIAPPHRIQSADVGNEVGPAGQGELFFENLVAPASNFVRFGLRDFAQPEQVIEVALAHRRAVLDRLVHPRLGERRLVPLVVPPAAETVHVDHDVTMKSGAEIQRQIHYLRNRFRILAVHVEDGNLQHLRHVAGIRAGPPLLRRRREAELVVDDDVDRPAHGVPGQLAQIQRLLHDPFTGKGRIAVDQQSDAQFAL